MGYGAKAFTLSMIETALEISDRNISTDVVEKILYLGKSLLEIPVKPLDGVEKTLKQLKQKKEYQLVVATKGDLLDQERKLERSGLKFYFDHVKVMSDKTEADYIRLCDALRIDTQEILMVGNSLKSDIQPVLALGGYAVHVPFNVMWKHEIVEDIQHERLKKARQIEDLLLWI